MAGRPTTSKCKKARENRATAVLLALILVAVLLIGAAGYYFLVDRPARRQSGAMGGVREAAALQGSLQNMSEEEIQAALDSIIEEGMFRISIASDIVAEEDGMAELRIENNLTNRYLMKVNIYLDETGEEIYATDLIDPGYYIQQAELDRHLEPGQYAATAVFTALYPDTGEIVGTAGANVTLHVFAASQTPTPSPTTSSGVEK